MFNNYKIMSKVSVRRAKLNEYSRIKFITKLAYKIPYKKDTLVTKPHESKDEECQFKKKKVHILVATAGNKIVGAIRYKLSKPNNLYFFKLAVLKTYRNAGIGSLLISELEKIAKKKGVQKMSLDCAKEKKLDRYYIKFGFKIEKVEDKNRHRLVHMSKKVYSFADIPKCAGLTNYITPVFGFLKKIPTGRVVSYGLVAKRCGLSNPRLVGRILKQNTEPKKIPCYRVVREDGRLADGYKFGGLIGQTKRLRADGIEFDGAKIKNFKEMLWKGSR